MRTSSKTAASTDGSIFLRRMHLTATWRPVARWTPRQTVEKVPLFSCRRVEVRDPRWWWRQWEREQQDVKNIESLFETTQERVPKQVKSN